jgi:hypothetical protein
MTAFQVRAQFFSKPVDPAQDRGWKLDTLQVIVIVEADTEEEAVKLVAWHFPDGIPPGKIYSEWHGEKSI